MSRIDLNCDMGESFGAWNMGADEAVHALDHLGQYRLRFPCRRPFGHAPHRGGCRAAACRSAHTWACRTWWDSGDAPWPWIAARCLRHHRGADRCTAGRGRAPAPRVGHVKPHGALYHMLEADPELADAVARAVRDVDPDLRAVGRSGGAWLAQAAKRGLAVLHEVFADRAYRPDGTLQPRGVPGASIDSREAAAAQAVRLACEGRVETVDGQALQLRADTLCIHGDRDDAESVARTIREHLDKAGVDVARASQG